MYLRHKYWDDRSILYSVHSFEQSYTCAVTHMHIPVRRFLHPPFNLWIPVPQHFFMKLLSLSCFQDALERLIKNGLIKKISPPTKAIHLFFNQ